MFRPQYIEILKSVPKLFFHESTSEQRYRTFENCIRREISLRIFRLLVEKNKHPGRISHLDVTSGPGITSGPGRTSHPVISGVCMAIYLSYVCHTGLYGHIWAYMGLYGTKFRQPQPWPAASRQQFFFLLRATDSAATGCHRPPNDISRCPTSGPGNP